MKEYSKDAIYIDPELRELFKKGILSHQWFKTYPMLFDEDDLRLAISQKHYHFYEWFGAIQIYKDLSYLCLVEQYQFRIHKKKRELYESIVPREVVDFIDSNDFGRRQAPDLLAYTKDKSDWFFCEVKGGSDYLHKSQAEAFQKLKTISRKDILIMKIQLKK